MLDGGAIVHLVIECRSCGGKDARGISDCVERASELGRKSAVARSHLNQSVHPVVGLRHPNLLLRFSAWAGHFRPPLTVARKFRLCLHPRGMLRVQSLHLPREGLGSALSAKTIIGNIFPVVNKFLLGKDGPPTRRTAHKKSAQAGGERGEKMSIEKSVQDYLVSHGITQIFVARKCGWSKQKAHAILSGKQKILAEDLKTVCDAIGVPYDYFFNAAKAAQDSA